MFMKDSNQSERWESGHRRNGPLAKSIEACRHALGKCSHYRDGIIQKRVGEVKDMLPEPLVRRAVMDAEALAWSTPFPLLFLPALVEEKVSTAREWADRQQQVLERQRALAGALRGG